MTTGGSLVVETNVKDMGRLGGLAGGCEAQGDSMVLEGYVEGMLTVGRGDSMTRHHGATRMLIYRCRTGLQCRKEHELRASRIQTWIRTASSVEFSNVVLRVLGNVVPPQKRRMCTP